MGATTDQKHTVWDHPSVRFLAPFVTAVLTTAVLNFLFDNVFDDPVPDSVAVGTAVSGPWPTVDPERLIPQRCPGVRDVTSLVNNGWDRDKNGRRYQDYWVDFGSDDKVDVARLYLDDASVRCP